MEQTQSIEQLVRDISTEKVVLPEFQRDFVWELSKTYDLFDSIVKDIFIGAIIYGIPSFEIAIRQIDTRDRITKGKRRPSLEVTTITFDHIKKRQRLNKSDFRLALDGQQRITSIYRAIKGIDTVWFIAKNENELEGGTFETSELEYLLHEFDGTEDPQRLSIKLSDVWAMDVENLDDDEIKALFFYKTAYFKNADADRHFDEKAKFKKFKYLRKKIIELYKQEKLISYYLLDMSLEKFVVFFERSNTKGIQLNFIDILAAKLYTGNFNLKKKIQEFESLNPNYTLLPEIIVRSLAYLKSHPKDINRNYILSELRAEDFIQHWDKLCEYYRKSLDFLYENNCLISQDWIPYNNLLIPMMVFLRELGGSFHHMTQAQKDFLIFWYFNASFSNRYSGSSNEKTIEDATIFSIIANGKKVTSISYFNRLTKIQLHAPDDVFSFNKKVNAVYKGVLNLINYHSKGLIDWNNDSRLSLNAELEDHHIYPKAFLENRLTGEAEKDFIDCVANRTLVPKRLNIKISDQKPSEYMRKIRLSNPNFGKTLENHLIPLDILSGELDDDFNLFLTNRCDKIFELVQLYLVQPLQSIKEKFYEELKLDEMPTINVFATFKQYRLEASFHPISKKLFYKGQQFDSPTKAAMFAKSELGGGYDSNENGWTFWRYIDHNGTEGRLLDFRNSRLLTI